MVDIFRCHISLLLLNFVCTSRKYNAIIGFIAPSVLQINAKLQHQTEFLIRILAVCYNVSLSCIINLLDNLVGGLMSATTVNVR